MARTAYMIADGVNPGNILLFTFTRKGANEIKDRVMRSIGDDAGKVTVGTYHSFCSRILRKHIECFNIWDHKFSIYDSEDSEKLLKSIVDNSDLYSKLHIKPKTLLTQISHWKERMLNPQEALIDADNADDVTLAKAIAQIYSVYARQLRELNALDFDDLIYLTIKMFERFPDIKDLVNDRYHYIVADESQDSSPRDLRLIRLLGGERMNVCLVGDDWQSETMLLM